MNLKKLYTQHRVTVFTFVLISALGTIIYFKSFFSGFEFDDHVFVINNPAIRDLFNLKLIWDGFNTRFLTGLTFAFNYKVAKLSVFGYHLFNLVVHITTSFLVYNLVLTIFKTPCGSKLSFSDNAASIALFSSLIFLAHPIQTQAVTYISQRAASMATPYMPLR